MSFDTYNVVFVAIPLTRTVLRGLKTDILCADPEGCRDPGLGRQLEVELEVVGLDT
jgi:hypothetical protein